MEHARHWLLRFADGVEANVPAGVVTAILADAATTEQSAVAEWPSCGQMVRSFLHAAGVAKQAESILLEIQSAVAVYPTTVPLLLEALHSQQRWQLADELLRIIQQQQERLHLPAAPPAWVQQLQQLSVWDVLLLLGLWSQPEWEADAGLVLLQGLQDMNSLHQISQLFAGLSTVCPDAAEWLLGVGLTWATTCHLDMGIEGNRFNKAGVWLLKGGIMATPSLARSGLQSALQQIVTEASINTSLWQVLQYVVAKCVNHHNAQGLQQLQQPCTSTFSANNTSISNISHVAGRDAVCSVCIEELSNSLPSMLQLPHTDVVLRFIKVIKPLVSVSCKIMTELLTAAAQQLRCAVTGTTDLLDTAKLNVKQEQQDGAGVADAALTAAAAVAALAGTQQQQLQSVRHRPRYSWGTPANDGSGFSDSRALSGRGGQVQATANPAAVTATGQHIGASSGAAAKTIETDGLAEAAAAATPNCALPSLSPGANIGDAVAVAAGLSTPVSAAAQHKALPLTVSASTTARKPGCVGMFEPLQRRSERLRQLLARVACAHGRSTPQEAPAAVGGHPTAAFLSLPAREQLAVALVTAVLRKGVPCSNAECQLKVVAGLQQMLQLLSPGGLQQIFLQCRQQQGKGQAFACVTPAPNDMSTSNVPADGVASTPMPTRCPDTPIITPGRNASAASAIRAANQCIVGGSSRSNGDHWPMQGLWRCALLGQLQSAILQDELSWQQFLLEFPEAVQPTTADHVGSSSDRNSSSWRRAQSVPLLVQGLLNSLTTEPQYTAAAAQAAATPLSLSQPQEGVEALDNQVAGLLGQVLSGLLRLNSCSFAPAATTAAAWTDHCPATPATLRPAASTGLTHVDVHRCRWQVQHLLWRYHITCELLSWMLQHKSAAKQVCAAAVAAGNFMQHSAVEAAAVELGDKAAANTRGDSTTAEAGAVGPAADASCTPSSETAALLPAVLQLAHQLQHLQALSLPTALQQLLAAQAYAAKEEPSLPKAAEEPPTAVKGTAAMPSATDDDSGKSDTGTAAKKKRNRLSCPFYVVRTPATKQQQPETGAGAAVQNAPGASVQAAADLAGNVACGANRSDGGGSIPLWLTQLPVLPLSVCHELLAAVLPMLQVLLASQDQQPQVTAPGIGSARRRRSSTAAGLNNTPATGRTARSLPHRTPRTTAPAATEDTAGAAKATHAPAVLGSPGVPVFPGFATTSVGRISARTDLALEGTPGIGGHSSDVQYLGRPACADASAPLDVPQAEAGCTMPGLTDYSQLSDSQLTPGAVAAARSTSSTQAVCVHSEQPGNDSIAAAAQEASQEVQQVLQLSEFAVCAALDAAKQQLDNVVDTAASVPGASNEQASPDMLLSCAVQLLQLHQAMSSDTFQAVMRTHQHQMQQHHELAAAALSAAANMLDCWLPAAACDGSEPAATAAHQVVLAAQLSTYLELLLQANSCTTTAAATAAATSGVSWADGQIVFGAGVGAGTWMAIKKVEKAEPPLAAMLVLLVKVYSLAKKHSQHQQQEHISNSQQVACTVVACDAAAASTASAAMLACGLLQQLVVLRKVAGYLYEQESKRLATSEGLAATGAGSGASGSGRAVSSGSTPQWLLRLLDSKLLQLALGQVLNASLVMSPDTACALVQLTHLSQAALAKEPKGKALALAGHMLCLHHAPQIYAAADVSIWGKQGLHILTGSMAGTSSNGRSCSSSSGSAAAAVQGWMRGCSRDVAVAAARLVLQLMLPNVLLSTAEQETAQHDVLPPIADSVKHWQRQAAVVAAVCNCCELLLHQQALHARRQQQQQRNSVISSIGAESDMHAGDGLQLVLTALSVCLEGPCCRAAMHMAAILDWQFEQQQQQHQHEEVHQPTATALTHPLAAEAAVAVGSGHSRKRSRKTPRQAQKQKVDLVASLQVQLASLLELGCAIGQLVVSSQRHIQQQQGMKQYGANAAWGGQKSKAALRQLLANLRSFSSTYQGLIEALDSAAEEAVPAAAVAEADCAIEGGQGGTAEAVGAAQQIGSVLERSNERCAAVSRKQALAAVVEVAAAALHQDSDGSSSDEDESEQQRQQENMQGDQTTPHQQQQSDSAAAAGGGDDAAAAADCAARFHDPDVHEELPYEYNVSSDDDTDFDSESEHADLLTKHPEQEQHLLKQIGQQQPDKRKDYLSNSNSKQHPRRHQMPNQLQEAGVAVQDIHADKSNMQLQHAILAAVMPAAAPAAPAGTDRTPQPSRSAGTAAAALAAAKAAAQHKQSGRNIPTPTSARQQQEHLQQQHDAAFTLTGLRQQQQHQQHQGQPAVQQPADNLGRELRRHASQSEQCTRVPQESGKQLLHVVCGELHAQLDLQTCQVQLPNGNTLSPSAFERMGGKGHFKKWRNSLSLVNEDGSLGVRLRSYLRAQKNADAVCLAAGTLTRCSGATAAHDDDAQTLGGSDNAGQAANSKSGRRPGSAAAAAIVASACGSSADEQQHDVADVDVAASAADENAKEGSIPVVTKRKRGRPPKNRPPVRQQHAPSAGASAAEAAAIEVSADAAETAVAHAAEAPLLAAGVSEGQDVPPAKRQRTRQAVVAPQQQRSELGLTKRRVQPVPVHAGHQRRQMQPCTDVMPQSDSQQAPGRRKPKGQQKAQQRQQLAAPAAAVEPARVRNAYVQACLAETRGRKSTVAAAAAAVMASGSSDDQSDGELSGDDSDYSDLEDFIVVDPEKDYGRVCAEVGKKLTWKHKWRPAGK